MAHTLYISNAFALSMLSRDGRIRSPYPIRDAAEALEYINNWEFHGAQIVSCIGHANTAAILSKLLERDLSANRTNIKLDDHSCILVGQYVGPRLPEGATELPEGATIEWWII